MKKEKSENQKPKKYPISKEFGFYKKYKLPFNELVFVNADRIMGVLPKAIRGTKKVEVKTKKIKSVSEFFDVNITVRNTVHEVQYSGLMIFISKNNYIAVYPPSTGSAIPVT